MNKVTPIELLNPDDYKHLLEDDTDLSIEVIGVGGCRFLRIPMLNSVQGPEGSDTTESNSSTQS